MRFGVAEFARTEQALGEQVLKLLVTAGVDFNSIIIAAYSGDISEQFCCESSV